MGDVVVRGLKLSTVFLGLLLCIGHSSGLWAADQKIELGVAWNCPQTSGEKLPSTSTITVDLKTNPPTVNAEAFKSAVDQLEKQYPHQDFSSCIEHWITQCDQALQNHPQKNLIPKKALWSEVLERTAFYQQEFQGKPPYIGPNSVINPEPTLTKLSEPNCGNDINESYLAKSVLSKSLANLTANLSQPCKTKLARNYARLLLESKCTPSTNMIDHAEECLRRDQEIAQATKQLAKLGLPLFTNLSQNYELNQSQCSHYQATETLLSDLTDMANSIDELSKCVELNPGQTKNIDHDTGTGFPASYRLKRIDSQNYEVALNLKIKTNGVKPPAPFATWEQKIQNCLDKANPYFKTPQNPLQPNGEQIKLQFKLYQPSSNASEPAPAQNDLTITDQKGFLTNSSVWRNDISCSAITHELLHLTGLVDEYPEAGGGMGVAEDGSLTLKGVNYDNSVKFFANDCRVIGPKNSIMYDQDQAWAKLNPNSAEPGSSLLLPAQFRAIVYPGCATKNRTYYLCARESLKTSRKSMGFRSQSCATHLPKECLPHQDSAGNAIGSSDWLK